MLFRSGLDWLFSNFKKTVLQWFILLLAVLPALFANYSLFPYQYVYYNQFTGGLRGAFRLYELDYWNLAFREGQLYLNATAPQNANIFVKESKYIAQTFARPDLIFNAYGAKELKQYDYIMVSTAQNADLKFANFQTVFVVQRDGVPLAFIMRPVNK